MRALDHNEKNNGKSYLSESEDDKYKIPASVDKIQDNITPNYSVKSKSSSLVLAKKVDVL
jgi:hypothetical protein